MSICVYYGPFGLFWSIKVHNGIFSLFWPISVHYGLFWSISVHYGLFWSISVLCSPLWFISVHDGPCIMVHFLSIVICVPFDPFWSIWPLESLSFKSFLKIGKMEQFQLKFPSFFQLQKSSRVHFLKSSLLFKTFFMGNGIFDGQQQQHQREAEVRLLSLSLAELMFDKRALLEIRLCTNSNTIKSQELEHCSQDCRREKLVKLL